MPAIQRSTCKEFGSGEIHDSTSNITCHDMFFSSKDEKALLVTYEISCIDSNDRTVRCGFKLIAHASSDCAFRSSVSALVRFAKYEALTL